MSLKSKGKWILPERIKIDDLLSFILQNRGIENENMFLNPKLEDIPSYIDMYDVKSASEKILKYLKEKKKIVIHGDYDSDGICAVSILWDFLFREVSKSLNIDIDVIPYIPSRVDQGYGLTESSLEDIKTLGGELVITVDCGIRDRELINRYIKDGLDFVITDHHQPPEDLNEVEYPLVHQLHPQKKYPQSEVCGTYVIYMLIQYMRKELGIENIYEGLDLVALSTVTDLMPLNGCNRIVVKYGLEEIRKGKRLGLKKLCEVAGIQVVNIDSYHLGYVIGPRINASGRIGNPLDAVKLLVSRKEYLCTKIAEELNETNLERQFLTENTLHIAESMISDINSKIYVILGDGWHEGIVGLVAGKLNERYHRPVLVSTNGRGSARSIQGFNITQALSKCSEYLDRYGGHELAAGFSIKKGREKEFVDCINDIANREISDDMLIKDVKVDLNLCTDDIGYELVNKIDRLKPFGYGNRKPSIVLTDLIIYRKQPMGKLGNHMKLVCKGDGIDLITLVMFNCNEDTDILNINDKIDVIGEAGINVWNGKEDIQFLVNEWRYSNS